MKTRQARKVLKKIGDGAQYKRTTAEAALQWGRRDVIRLAGRLSAGLVAEAVEEPEDEEMIAPFYDRYSAKTYTNPSSTLSTDEIIKTMKEFAAKYPPLKLRRSSCVPSGALPVTTTDLVPVLLDGFRPICLYEGQVFIHPDNLSLFAHAIDLACSPEQLGSGDPFEEFGILDKEGTPMYRAILASFGVTGWLRKGEL